MNKPFVHGDGAFQVDVNTAIECCCPREHRIFYIILSNDEYTIHSCMYKYNHNIVILFVQASQTIDALME